MEEILSKRITLLTNAIIILSGLGFLALIHHVDASYKEKEYVALNSLRNCIEAIPQNASDPVTESQAAKKWLMSNNKAVFAKQVQVADTIASKLSQAGFSYDVKNYKTIGSAELIGTDRKPRPYGFLLLQTESTDTAANCCEHGFGNLTGNNKLRHFIAQYNHLMSGTRFSVATGISDTAVAAALRKNPRITAFSRPETNQNILEEIVSEIPALYSTGIGAVNFADDTCAISFHMSSSYMQQGSDETISFPVETTKLQGPTLMDMYELDPDFKKLGKETELQKIVQHYGDLPMDKAIEMIGDDYMEAYENVDIFGFTFSTTSLPLALLTFFSFLSTGLFLMVREARKQKLKVLSEFNNEDITDYFLKNQIIRTILWLVLPVLSLIATLPALPVEKEKLIVLGLGGLIMGVLNSITLISARKI